MKRPKRTYPYMAFRPPADVCGRIIGLAAKIQESELRRVTLSEVVVRCVRAHLPQLEAKYKS